MRDRALLGHTETYMNIDIRNITQRKLPSGSSAVDVSMVITGDYRPPPYVDLDVVAEDSINSNGAKVVNTLRERGERAGRDYFSRVEGIEAVRESKKVRKREDGGGRVVGIELPVRLDSYCFHLTPRISYSYHFIFTDRTSDEVANQLTDNIPNRSTHEPPLWRTDVRSDIPPLRGPLASRRRRPNHGRTRGLANRRTRNHLLRIHFQHAYETRIGRGHNKRIRFLHGKYRGCEFRIMESTRQFQGIQGNVRRVGLNSQWHYEGTWNWTVYTHTRRGVHAR